MRNYTIKKIHFRQNIHLQTFFKTRQILTCRAFQQNTQTGLALAFHANPFYFSNLFLGSFVTKHRLKNDPGVPKTDTIDHAIFYPKTKAPTFSVGAF